MSVLSTLHGFVLEILDGLCQLSQDTRLDRIFAILKLPYRALGNFRLAREKFRRKLLRSCPDLI
jgi:hypothetical protein